MTVVYTNSLKLQTAITGMKQVEMVQLGRNLLLIHPTGCGKPLGYLLASLPPNKTNEKYWFVGHGDWGGCDASYTGLREFV